MLFIFHAKLKRGVQTYFSIKQRVKVGGDSIITSRPEGRWVYTFFVILRDGKLEGWVVLD